MTTVFWALGALAYLFGCGMWAVSKGAIHEALALLTFVIGTLFVVGAAIVGALEKVANQESVKPKQVSRRA